MGATILRSSHLATFGFQRGCTELIKGKGMSQIPDAQSLELTLADLRKVQGEALIVGGLAVGYYGHERATKDIDVLYAYEDAQIKERLEPYFKLVNKTKGGWHHFVHRRTGVRLELIPEAGLTTYGFIPAPRTVGGKDGFVSLFGLVWLKLVSGRLSDLADIARLAETRMSEIAALRDKLPPELRDRLDELLERTRREIASDPNRQSGDVDPTNAPKAEERPAHYGKRRRKGKVRV